MVDPVHIGYAVAYPDDSTYFIILCLKFTH